MRDVIDLCSQMGAVMCVCACVFLCSELCALTCVLSYVCFLMTCVHFINIYNALTSHVFSRVCVLCLSK